MQPWVSAPGESFPDLPPPSFGPKHLLGISAGTQTSPVHGPPSHDVSAPVPGKTESSLKAQDLCSHLCIVMSQCSARPKTTCVRGKKERMRRWRGSERVRSRGDVLGSDHG